MHQLFRQLRMLDLEALKIIFHSRGGLTALFRRKQSRFQSCFFTGRQDRLPLCLLSCKYSAVGFEIITACLKGFDLTLFGINCNNTLVFGNIDFFQKIGKQPSRSDLNVVGSARFIDIFD